MFKPPRFIAEHSGFNIIEILIMISLVTLTFVAIMSLVLKNVELEYLNKNDYLAISLVKEGVELTEEVRNDNLLNEESFYKDISCFNPPLCSVPPPENWTCHYRLDYQNARAELGASRLCYDGFNPSPTPPQVSDPAYALQFDVADYYQHGSGALSHFHRMLTAVWHNGIATGPYLDVTADVYWAYRGQGYTYSLTTIIFNDD